MYEFIGYLAGICLAISFLPQMIQTFKTKNVQGMSAVTYSIYNLGVLCWVIYGAYLHFIPMIVFNSISLCLSVPILVMIIKYKK